MPTMLSEIDVGSINFGIPYIELMEADLEKMSKEEVESALAYISEIKRMQQVDPVEYGWNWNNSVVDYWGNSDIHFVLGGNRSAKSTFMGRLFIRLAELIPEAELTIWHTTEEMSVRQHQALIWEWLPQKYKDLRDSTGGRSGLKTYSIQYNQKNGFTDNILILPPQAGYIRGSQIKFMNYASYSKDPQVAEGWRAHAIWCDEEVPYPLYKTLLFRLSDFEGKLFVSFTTVKGYTNLVSEVLYKAKALKSRYADLIHEEIPVVQESNKCGKVTVHYFWTEDNKSVPFDRLRDRYAEGGNREELLCRLYGIPTKNSATKFPKFDKGVHIYDGDLPIGEYCRYMVLDPAGSKSWFMLWGALDAFNNIYIYREYPDFKTYGAWAEAGDRPIGKGGSASEGRGMGFDDYVGVMRDLEKGEMIWKRIIDPRLGQATMQSADGTTTIQGELAKRDIHCDPATGTAHIEDGLGMINDALAYDDSKKIDMLNNHPRLYVHKDCEQLIYALENYRNCGKDEACKDPIDCLRYLLTTEGVGFYTAKDLEVKLPKW